MFLISSVGSVAGPIFVGAVYDVSGEYRLAFLLTAVAALVAAPTVLLMSSPKPAEEAKDAMVVA